MLHCLPSCIFYPVWWGIGFSCRLDDSPPQNPHPWDNLPARQFPPERSQPREFHLMHLPPDNFFKKRCKVQERGICHTEIVPGLIVHKPLSLPSSMLFESFNFSLDLQNWLYLFFVKNSFDQPELVRASFSWSHLYQLWQRLKTISWVILVSHWSAD